MNNAQFAKQVLFVSSLVPAAMLAWDWYAGQTGADPGFYLMRGTGLCAIIFLMLSLCVTPLRRLTGRNYWSLYRRMLGLYAFAYAAMHVAVFFVFYLGGDIGRLVSESLKRQFVFFGMAAFLMMVPLAATSTAWAIKKMGNKKWKLLHKLVYLAAISAVIHYCLFSKTVSSLQWTFVGVVAVLLGFRVVVWLGDRAGKGGTLRAVAAATESKV